MNPLSVDEPDDTFDPDAHGRGPLPAGPDRQSERLVIDDATPLHAVRDMIGRERWHGIDCPACGQYARVYVRKLNRSMSIALLKLYRAGSVDGPVHTPSVLKGNRGEEARLSYWGLTRAVPRPGSPPGSPPSRGWWAVTRRGALWLLDGCTVPASAVIYDGTCMRLMGPPVGIRDALDDPAFSLRELLDTYAPPPDAA